MSQRLPALPSLDYLKKQAKDVLRVSRRRDAHCRLADAQNALARGYGFRSWTDLKTRVDSIGRQRSIDADSPVPDAPAGPRRNRHGDSDRSSQSGHPMTGTWVINPESSREGETRIPADDVLVDVHVSSDVVTLTQVALDRNGQQLAVKMAIHADGRDHALQFGEELALQARWASALRLETLVKRGDAVVNECSYEVSPDGQSLVVSTPADRLVFVRV